MSCVFGLSFLQFVSFSHVVSKRLHVIKYFDMTLSEMDHSVFWQYVSTLKNIWIQYFPVEMHLIFDFSRYRHDTRLCCRNAGIVETIERDFFFNVHILILRVCVIQNAIIYVNVGVLNYKNKLFWRIESYFRKLFHIIRTWVYFFRWTCRNLIYSYVRMFINLHGYQIYFDSIRKSSIIFLHCF